MSEDTYPSEDRQRVYAAVFEHHLAGGACACGHEPRYGSYFSHLTGVIMDAISEPEPQWFEADNREEIPIPVPPQAFRWRATPAGVVRDTPAARATQQPWTVTVNPLIEESATMTATPWLPGDEGEVAGLRDRLAKVVAERDNALDEVQQLRVVMDADADILNASKVEMEALRTQLRRAAAELGERRQERAILEQKLENVCEDRDYYYKQSLGWDHKREDLLTQIAAISAAWSGDGCES